MKADKKNFKNGIPKYNESNMDETARKYFQLGREAAQIDSQRKETEQLAQVNMLQKIMLQEQMMQQKQMMADLDRQMQTGAMASSMIPEPPMGGMAPPEGLPMSGMGTEGMGMAPSAPSPPPEMMMG